MMLSHLQVAVSLVVQQTINNHTMNSWENFMEHTFFPGTDTECKTEKLLVLPKHDW